MTEPAASSRLHIFRAGTYIAMSGDTVTLTPADLAACAAAYDRALHEAPLVAGHPQHNDPAHGWVCGLHAVGEDLEAEPCDVAADFAEAVRARRFAKISASFWPPAHPGNPKPGCWYLRHVGFLGAAAPAVAGLRPVQLAAADDDPDLVTIDLAAPAAALTPEPEMADDMNPTAESAAKAAPTKPATDAASTADFAAREQALAEREAELTRQAETLAAREQAAREQAAAVRRTEITSFCAGLVDQGRLLPVERAPLAALLEQLPEAPAVDFAAAGDDPQPRAPGAWLREWLAGLPVRVPYGEFAAPDGHDPAEAAIEAAARTMAGLPPAAPNA